MLAIERWTRLRCQPQTRRPRSSQSSTAWESAILPTGRVDSSPLPPTAFRRPRLGLVLGVADWIDIEGPHYSQLIPIEQAADRHRDTTKAATVPQRDFITRTLHPFEARQHVMAETKNLTCVWDRLGRRRARRLKQIVREVVGITDSDGGCDCPPRAAFLESSGRCRRWGRREVQFTHAGRCIPHMPCGSITNGPPS